MTWCGRLAAHGTHPSRHPPEQSAPVAQREHDDVHRGLADAVQRRLTGFGEAHLVAETTQSQLQALPGSRIILD